ncbi:D-aspartate oxidase [Contarinia nasturtii]|uniref:D-aspartate oxidase n=1 Tax=Contarinia nasturtii TaxID=265458 RepID=UPI0012D3D9BF|nr:D-aspartate oxidase [Contarinia nasturtii]
MSFAVLGAGVCGLSTALEVQNKYPNSKVSLIAEKFGRDTTSDVAAGIFRPGPSFSGPNETVTRKWMNDSYAYWDKLRLREDASLSGVTQLSAYVFSSTDPSIVRNHFLEGLLPLYRPCTEEELSICPGDWKYGSFFTTVLTECRLWQSWAQRKFEQNNGKVVQKQITKLTEFNGKKYDAVFNCTGLGAQKLCNDVKVVPIRGQIIKVRAPWVKTAFYADYDTYILPGFGGIVTLGGTRSYESYNMKIDKYDSLSIRERCEALVPSLAKATVVREAVGLRPYRSSVRVEHELLKDSFGQPLRVIHNYGHGGYGVTTSPGTAAYAVHLFGEMHRSKL